MRRGRVLCGDGLFYTGAECLVPGVQGTRGPGRLPTMDGLGMARTCIYPTNCRALTLSVAVPRPPRWFTAMESRPTYIATRSDHYTTSHDLPPQVGLYRSMC